MKLLRPVCNVALFIAVFVAPFWVSLCLLTLGLLIIPYYVESIIALFCFELLYHGSTEIHETLRLFTPVIVVAFFFAVQGLRRIAHEHIFRF
jgi:hypothetical protein